MDFDAGEGAGHALKCDGAIGRADFDGAAMASMSCFERAFLASMRSESMSTARGRSDSAMWVRVMSSPPPIPISRTRVNDQKPV